MMINRLSPKPANKKLRDLLHKIEDLQNRVGKIQEKFANHRFIYDNKYRFEDLKKIAPSWTIKVVKASTALANRSSSMLSGPFFTSSQYPWPIVNGSPLLPLVQMDLREASDLRSTNLGDGLLQVFISDNNDVWEARVVPRNIVDTAKTTKIPVFKNEEICIPLDWAEMRGEYYSITGFGAPKISSCVQFDMPSRLPKELKNMAEEVHFIYGNTMTFHMFGTFESPQYSASERPQCFMSFESEYGYAWGSGAAQIFYEINNDEVKFIFEYVC